MNKKLIILMIIISMLLTSCGYSNLESSIGISKTFLYQIKNKNNDAAFLMCCDEFVENIGKDELVRFIETANEKYGDIEFYKLISATYKKTGFGEKRGGYAIVVFSVSYQEETVEEQIILYKKKNKDEFKILSYNIAFSEELDL